MGAFQGLLLVVVAAIGCRTALPIQNDSGRTVREATAVEFEDLDWMLRPSFKAWVEVDFGDGTFWVGTYSLEEQHVEFMWGVDDFPGASISKHPVDYFPTGILPLRDRTVCVIGCTTAGEMILERWAIGRHAKVVSADSSADQQGGPIRPGEVTSRRVIFVDESGALGPPWAIFENLGEPVGSSVFVLPLYSRDVLRIDLGTGECCVALTMDAAPTALGLLGNYAPGIPSGKGFSYRFDNFGPCLTLLDELRRVALADLDGDGVLDRARTY